MTAQLRDKFPSRKCICLDDQRDPPWTVRFDKRTGSMDS